MTALPCQLTLAIPSEQAMASLAMRLADDLQPGDVLALNGPMGSGKTTFVRHLGRALGVREPVTSPTFALIHDYETGRIPLTHVDLYRLGEENAHRLSGDLLTIADEGRSVLLVEWAGYGAFMDDLSNFQIDLAYDPDAPDARIMTIHSRRPLPGLTEDALP